MTVRNKEVIVTKKKKTSARSAASAATHYDEVEDDNAVDLMYVHYEKTQKGYNLYVSPQIVRAFWDEYGIELEYDAESKIFKGAVRNLPASKLISFIEYKNTPIAPNILNQALAVRENLEALDNQMNALKDQHDELRKQAMAIIMQHGIKTKKGRVAHKKILTGNWITSIRQLIPDVSLKNPSIQEVEDLMDKFPKHKKQIKKLLANTSKCYEIQDIVRENFIDVVCNLSKYNIKDAKVTFKSSDDINEEVFPTCFSWDDIDLDLEKAERVLADLPFEVKLDLYTLPEIEDNPLQFHYKTDQKTDYDCIYCGGDFYQNTHTCSECGLTSVKIVKKKKNE